MKSNDKPSSYDNMNVFLKNCIKHMNNDYNVNFDPKEYTPHSLRVGCCLQKLGKPLTLIWTEETLVSFQEFLLRLSNKYLL